MSPATDGLLSFVRPLFQPIQDPRSLGLQDTLLYIKASRSWFMMANHCIAWFSPAHLHSSHSSLTGSTTGGNEMM